MLVVKNVKKKIKKYTQKTTVYNWQILFFSKNRLSINQKNVKNSKSVQTKSYHCSKIFIDFSLVFNIKYNI